MIQGRQEVDGHASGSTLSSKRSGNACVSIEGKKMRKGRNRTDGGSCLGV